MRPYHELLLRVLFGAAFIGATGVGAAGCGGPPQKAGDACTIDDDLCPTGTVCQESDDGQLCRTEAGGECDVDAEKPYCMVDAKCELVDEGDTTGHCIRHIGEGGDCDPKNSEFEKCDDGLTCAEVAAGGHKCYEPAILKGQVFDSETTDGIEGAHVIALDEVATAVTDVAITDVDGNYELEVPIPRDDKGAPIKDRAFTLRAEAQDYQTFPGGLRTALPIITSEAKSVDNQWVIETALTGIALIALPDGDQGQPSISGTVLAGDSSGGVLVIAEAGGKGISSISDKKGAYTIFNVPDGNYTVAGYAAGVQLTPESADVAGKDLTGVDLASSSDALGSITGKLSIVNGGDGKATSVVLVVESTFSDTFVRGEVPRGLRTPLKGDPDVVGDFTIENVPAGKYVILAAFENDLLVRDPDMGISGTQILHQEMASPGEDITLASSFKITGALTVFGPGAEVPEGVTTAPTLSWADDSSEEFYKVFVYDAYGELVWSDENVPGQSGVTSIDVVYGGPLEKGMYYQFRASSWRDKNGTISAISATEDLRGVFFGQ